MSAGAEARIPGLLGELRAAFETSDLLFSMLPEGALFERPIALRHPFVFYLGHLPAFAWNQVGRGALGLPPMREDFDQLFERGIDPEDESSTAPESCWPDLAEILAYRDQVRAALPEAAALLPSRPEDPLAARGRVLDLVLEHELMHHETLLYMFQEREPGQIRWPDHLPRPRGGPGRASRRVEVPAGLIVLGARWSEVDFGWDNEFEAERHEVPAFVIDSLPVRNQDWLEFWRGTEDLALWPINWVRADGQIQVATVSGRVPFALAEGWPVQVTGTAARAYCAARGGRLPTEVELKRAATGEPGGGQRSYPWGEADPTTVGGNFGYRSWSPDPVGEHPETASAWGVEELVGNGWEWTATPFRPLAGFTPWARSYPGYSADFFDDAHDVVFGASWATAPRLMRPSFRNWYRRGYPYPFTSFRVVTERA